MTSALNTTAQFNDLSRCKAAADLLEKWLAAQLPADRLQWLTGQLEKIERSNSDRDLHITLGMIPRKLGREDLRVTDTEAVESSVPGWRPQHWSIDAAARVLVLCRLAERDENRFAEVIVDLCRTADLNESR